jgi:hypothetical protein
MSFMVTREERASIQRAAKRKGQLSSEWIRETLLRAARRRG